MQCHMINTHRITRGVFIRTILQNGLSLIVHNRTEVLKITNDNLLFKFNLYNTKCIGRFHYMYHIRKIMYHIRKIMFKLKQESSIERRNVAQTIIIHECTSGLSKEIILKLSSTLSV